MTQAQLKVLEAVNLRAHTRSELIAVACKNGCRSVIRSEFLIDLLHRQGYLKRFVTRANEVTMYRIGDKKHEEDRGPSYAGRESSGRV